MIAIGVGDLVRVRTGVYAGTAGRVTGVSLESGAVVAELRPGVRAAFGSGELVVEDRAVRVIPFDRSTRVAGTAGKVYYESGDVR